MRTKALILFFPLAVFLAETGSFTSAMKNACAIVAANTNACKKEKKEDACVRNKQNKACTKIKQQNKCCTKTPVGKLPANNDCNDKADCSTCPVCYTFIFQQQYEWQAQQFLLKRNYIIANIGYITSYSSDVWKPPNGFQRNS